MRRGRMTLRVVPGNTVERITTSWRVGFDRDCLTNFGRYRLDCRKTKRSVPPA